MKRILVAVALVLALQPASLPVESVAPIVQPAAATADSTVQAAQLVLRSYGYAIAVDGLAGPQTATAVRHWQQSNGLVVDGVIGQQTLRSLGISIGTLVAASRVDPPVEQGPPSEPCAEAAWYSARAGLPDTVDVAGGRGGFDDRPTRTEADFADLAIPIREAGCDNSAGNSCCGGWYGIHQSNIHAPGYRAGFTACGITSRSDYQGQSTAQKAASACAAAVLYNYWLAHPGQPWPWRL